MRRFRLQCSFVLLLGLLVVSLGLTQTQTAQATGPVIGPTSSSTFVVRGVWADSRVDLAAAIDANPNTMNIPITDQSYLRVGWTVRVSSEQMYIRELIENYPNPDTMVVWRAWNGTSSASHSQGSQIDAHTLTIDIYAQNITDPNGLGAFDLYLTFPPETQYIMSSIDTAWLSSTGRDPNCDGPIVVGNTVHMWCFTVGDLGNPGHPLGSTGSGIIARVTLLPSEQLMSSTVSLAGSSLGSLSGPPMSAGVTNIRVRTIDCPDVNLDGAIDIADALTVSRHSNDRGTSSGVTLVEGINSTVTQFAISDQSLFQVGNTVSIDSEIMSVDQLIEGTPDMMVVTRGLNNSRPTRAHSANAAFFLNNVDGNFDGKYGYSPTRDPDHDLGISIADQLIIARVFGMYCPAP